MQKIEWPIKNQNAKYKFSENPSKESSINISKEIFEFLGAKNSGDIVTVTLRKKDFLLAFSKIVSNLPLYYYRNGSQQVKFGSEFFESNYNEIAEHFGENERISYQLKLRINDESTIRYYLYRIDGAKNFILRDFLIGENSFLNFIKNDNGEIVIEPVITVINNESKESSEEQEDSSDSMMNFSQIIYYGVPGSGKSYSIAQKLSALGITKDNASQYTKRVVFHPEYTNADFVGQILPRSESDGSRISYPFVSGPFTQLLALAYTHKNHNFALIIEEINRGNAAAIFGELFQLLDRLDKDENESSNGYKYTVGWSSYPVSNDSINHAICDLYDEHKKDPSKYPDFDPFIPKENFELYKENIGIRLPPNFSIFATMNTSDQNVFKLDNAFKRRFDLELIPNVFDLSNPDLKEQKTLIINQRDAEVEGFGFTWNQFREAVNEIITSPENEFDISSFADRQIGCWFVKAEVKSEKDTEIKSELKVSKKTFMNKVLEYLWDDVCGGEREIFFNSDFKTLSELINAVEKDNKTDIFSKDLQTKIDSKKNPE